MAKIIAIMNEKGGVGNLASKKISAYIYSNCKIHLITIFGELLFLFDDYVEREFDIFVEVLLFFYLAQRVNLTSCASLI